MFKIEGMTWKRKRNGMWILVRTSIHPEPKYRRERKLPSKARLVYRKQSKA